MITPPQSALEIAKEIWLGYQERRPVLSAPALERYLEVAIEKAITSTIELERARIWSTIPNPSYSQAEVDRLVKAEREALIKGCEGMYSEMKGSEIAGALRKWREK